MLKGKLSQKPSSSRVLRSVPPSLTLLSVICWVPFWVVSSPFFSTNTRKSPSRETWRETVVYLKKSKSPHLARFLPHGFLHELVLLLQPAYPPLRSQNSLNLHLQFFFLQNDFHKTGMHFVALNSLHLQGHLEPQIWPSDAYYWR